MSDILFACALGYCIGYVCGAIMSRNGGER